MKRLQDVTLSAPKETAVLSAIVSDTGLFTGLSQANIGQTSANYQMMRSISAPATGVPMISSRGFPSSVPGKQQSAILVFREILCQPLFFANCPAV